MNFEDWLKSVPAELTGDPLWKNEAYRLAVLMSDLAWQDVSKLVKDKRTISLSNQLFRAVGSVGANIAEGYSRRSGKDQARFYEYSLGSAREARHWYYGAKHVLPEPVVTHRAQLLTKTCRLLLKMIPSERGYKLKEEPEQYSIEMPNLLKEIPL